MQWDFLKTLQSPKDERFSLQIRFKIPTAFSSSGSPRFDPLQVINPFLLLFSL